MNKIGYLVIAGVIALVVLLSSIFVVDERERALVLQFGQIQRVEAEPGLKFKVPFIQNVVTYDDRILALDTPPIEVTPSDDRRLVVDAFARYRVADVVQLRQATGAGGLRAAEQRLEGILNPEIRAVLGSDGVTSNTNPLGGSRGPDEPHPGRRAERGSQPRARGGGRAAQADGAAGAEPGCDLRQDARRARA